MSGDVLIHLLRMVQAELPAVPPEKWAAIEQALRAEHGGAEHYIARRSKASLLGQLDAAVQQDQDMTAAQLAQRLGVTVRHAKRLRRLAKPGESG